MKLPRCYVYDSLLDREYPEHRVWAVTYEPFWQELRLTCAFSDVDEIRPSLTRLEAYMQLATDEADERNRVFRVLNLLNAIPIGQATEDGLQRVSRDEENMILPFREVIRLRQQAIGRPRKWDWNVTRTGMRKMWKDNPDGLYTSCSNIVTRRAYRIQRKPEMYHYLSLFAEVSNESN